MSDWQAVQPHEDGAASHGTTPKSTRSNASFGSRKAKAKSFRVKVKLISLSGISGKTPFKPPTLGKKKGHDSEEPRVTAFASFVVDNKMVKAKVKGEKKGPGKYKVERMSHVPSLPFPDGSLKNKPASWGHDKGSKSDCPHTVYLSALLRPEDKRRKKKQEHKENDDRNVSHSSEIDQEIGLSPEFININVGLMREKDMIHLGTTTFVVRGHEVKGHLIDLPVRVGEVVGFIVSETGASVSEPNLEKAFLPHDANKKKLVVKKRGLFKRFGGRPTGEKFTGDQRTFGISANAILRVSVDVKSMETVRNIVATRQANDAVKTEAKPEKPTDISFPTLMKTLSPAVSDLKSPMMASPPKAPTVASAPNASAVVSPVKSPAVVSPMRSPIVGSLVSSPNVAQPPEPPAVVNPTDVPAAHVPEQQSVADSKSDHDLKCVDSAESQKCQENEVENDVNVHADEENFRSMSQDSRSEAAEAEEKIGSCTSDESTDIPKQEIEEPASPSVQSSSSESEEERPSPIIPIQVHNVDDIETRKDFGLGSPYSHEVIEVTTGHAGITVLTSAPILKRRHEHSSSFSVGSGTVGSEEEETDFIIKTVETGNNIQTNLLPKTSKVSRRFMCGDVDHTATFSFDSTLPEVENRDGPRFVKPPQSQVVKKTKSKARSRGGMQALSCFVQSIGSDIQPNSVGSARGRDKQIEDQSFEVNVEDQSFEVNVEDLSFEVNGVGVNDDFDSEEDQDDFDHGDDGYIDTESESEGDSFVSGKSVGDATIESLKAARETLRRYASRTGLSVDQLIEAENASLAMTNDDSVADDGGSTTLGDLDEDFEGGDGGSTTIDGGSTTLGDDGGLDDGGSSQEDGSESDSNDGSYGSDEGSSLR